MYMFLAEAEQDNALSFASHTVNKCPFHSLFSAMFFCIWVLLLVIWLGKISPKHSAEVLMSVPRYMKTVLCLMEKMHVLDKLPSGMNYSAVGCEFNVNE